MTHPEAEIQGPFARLYEEKHAFCDALETIARNYPARAQKCEDMADFYEEIVDNLSKNTEEFRDPSKQIENLDKPLYNLIRGEEHSPEGEAILGVVTLTFPQALRHLKALSTMREAIRNIAQIVKEDLPPNDRILSQLGRLFSHAEMVHYLLRKQHLDITNIQASLEPMREAISSIYTYAAQKKELPLTESIVEFGQSINRQLYKLTDMQSLQIKLPDADLTPPPDSDVMLIEDWKPSPKKEHAAYIIHSSEFIDRAHTLARNFSFSDDRKLDHFYSLCEDVRDHMTAMEFCLGRLLSDNQEELTVLYPPRPSPESFVQKLNAAHHISLNVRQGLRALQQFQEIDDIQAENSHNSKQSPNPGQKFQTLLTVARKTFKNARKLLEELNTEASYHSRNN